MNIKPIKTKRDHTAALKRVDELWNAKANSPEGDELEVLSTLIAVYENEHTPIEAPDPIEALKFRLDQMSITREELAKLLGGKNRVSEVLNGKRKLSFAMMKNLHKHLNIPAASFFR
jgi:HTH-type transcriptional regulator / antitoxin HigA